MNLKRLKRKRNKSNDRGLKLPLRNERKVVGVFNSLNVIVHDWSSMNFLYKKGCFGKGSFSKREPNYHTKKDDIPKLIFEQQLKNQRIWGSAIEYVCPKKYYSSRKKYELSLSSVEKFLESSFSSYDAECQKSWTVNYQSQHKNLKQELSFLEFHPGESPYEDKFYQVVDGILLSRQGNKSTISSCMVKNEEIVLSVKSEMTSADETIARFEPKLFLPEENLNLTWEESFYLKSIFGCMLVIDWDKKNLTDIELWEKFKATDQNFVRKYVTYHHYRSKGWIIRSGVKFGGDYLLYKIGPAHYHANYLIKVLNEKKLSWKELIVNNRLAETFNKDIVFVRVSSFKGVKPDVLFPEFLENYQVEETLINRWFPSKERKL